MIKRLSIFCGLFLALPLLAGTLSVADYGAVGDAFRYRRKTGVEHQGFGEVGEQFNNTIKL